VKRKLNLSKLGGQLGVGLCVAGFLLVFLGWNGAASRDRVPAQFPYLLSGGIAGLCLVVMGVGMLIVQNQRADRAALQSSLDRLREAVERAGGGPVAGNGHGAAVAPVAPDVPDGSVLGGASSYHRPDCKLAVGRVEAEVLTLEEATERGLEACRVCRPEVPPTPPSNPRRRAPLRAGESS
jgi:hypothetical protein